MSSLHEREIGRQRALEALGLLQPALQRIGVGIGGPVDDRGAHGVREQGRPRGAELAAVTEPEVADLVLAQGLAQHVHVPGAVVRPDMLDDVGVVLRAARREVLGDVDDLLALRLVVGRDVGAGVIGVVVVDAVDRRLALAGPAGIPPDDVEALEELLTEDELGEQPEIAAAEARPTRVDQQRTDLVVLVPGQMARDVQLGRLAIGVVVVDGHLEDGRLRVLADLSPVERASRLGALRGRRLGGVCGIGRLRRLGFRRLGRRRVRRLGCVPHRLGAVGEDTGVGAARRSGEGHRADERTEPGGSRHVSAW